jgi:hypothetical protein
MVGKTKHDELGEVLEGFNPLMAPLKEAVRAVGGVFARRADGASWTRRASPV